MASVWSERSYWAGLQRVSGLSGSTARPAGSHLQRRSCGDTQSFGPFEFSFVRYRDPLYRLALIGHNLQFQLFGVDRWFMFYYVLTD
jgi:hypothetical protein